MPRLRLLLVPLAALALLAGCGGNAKPASSSIDPDTGQNLSEPYQPSMAQVRNWPAAWCNLHVGMSRQDTRKPMGSPTETFPDQDSWDAFGYSFTAFYDEYGSIRQLDYNTLGISAAQKARIPCADTRS